MFLRACVCVSLLYFQISCFIISVPSYLNNMGSMNFWTFFPSWWKVNKSRPKVCSLIRSFSLKFDVEYSMYMHYYSLLIYAITMKEAMSKNKYILCKTNLFSIFSVYGFIDDNYICIFISCVLVCVFNQKATDMIIRQVNNWLAIIDYVDVNIQLTDGRKERMNNSHVRYI